MNNYVTELCNLHDYIAEHFENAVFVGAEAPETNWINEKVVIRFTSNGRKYKYALTDETEEKAE